MYILLTDETNRDEGENRRFFVYGGLVVPLSQVINIDRKIRNLRRAFGYQGTDTLKFDTNARPNNVSFQDGTTLKNSVVNICIEHNCRFIVHVIHHKVLGEQNLGEYTLKSADYVIGRFHQFLRSKNSFGYCFIDRLSGNEQYEYMSDKFTRGLIFDDRDDIPLNRILLFGSTTLKASHLNSATDIILGSFRYCINNPRNEDAASQMMKNVMSLLWKGDGENIEEAEGNGFIVRPPIDEIRSRTIKFEYNRFIDHINGLISPE